MDYKEVFTIIINCLLVHAAFKLDIPSYFVNTYKIASILATMNCGFGFFLLLFPSAVLAPARRVCDTIQNDTKFIYISGNYLDCYLGNCIIVNQSLM